MPDLHALRQRLERAGQQHLLNFHDRLAPDARRSLFAQIEAIDLDAVPALVRDCVLGTPPVDLPADIEPAPYYPNDPSSPVRPWDRAAYRAEGEALLRGGKVACFTVAGGQGTRLGYDGPKGCYPAGAVTGKPLFQFFAEGILKTGEKYGVTPPWYVMTSPLNHDATVAFFEQRGYFGLPHDGVMFFPQGTMPSFDLRTGRILLAAPGEIATNPDGHGGSLRALKVSGALGDMRRRGVEHISYFQVDNPIVRVADPVFLGLHAAAPDSSAEMSSKMLAKAYPEEKLGMFCVAGGRLRIIEYSDLPMERQRERLPDGRLRFLADSPAIHVLSVEFVERLNSDPAFALPWHRAEKKVRCIDPDTGERIEPREPNGVKLERFVFDALPLARASIVYEADRVEEFAPIKNAEGVDSPQTSREIQTLRAARWLEAAGVHIPWKDSTTPECTIELSPLTAVEREDIAGSPKPALIEQGAPLAL
ncbi:MAG TPA: UTP--glucose-1-phosphate uridylyltransferase [Phycisphaerales bacterium]|nr:UTP--glucose-1-phosphate uridylyltransferase [Phycisphaerales bacterium]